MLSSIALAALAAAAPMALDLPAAQRLAAEHSRRVEARELEAAAAREREGEARGRRLPRLSLSARYTRQSWVDPPEIALPLELTGGRQPEPVRLGEGLENQYSLRAGLEQPLFTGLALREGARAAAAGAKAAQARLAQERQDVEVRVEEAFAGLQRALAAQRVARQSVSFLEAHLGDVGRLHAEGAVARSEVAAAAARLAGARSAAVRAQGAAAQARLSLLSLLGLPAGTELELVAPPPDSAPPGDPAELVDRALARRPELAAAQASGDALGAQAGAAAGALWPQLALRAGAAFENPNPRHFPLEDEFRGTWEASLVLSWNALDAAAWHAVRARRADAAAARLAQEDLRDAVRLEVRRRHAEVVAADARLTAAAEAVRAARLALDAADDRCRLGQTSCTRVLDAELEHVRALVDELDARAEARLARVHLRRASGG